MVRPSRLHEIGVVRASNADHQAASNPCRRDARTTKDARRYFPAFSAAATTSSVAGRPPWPLLTVAYVTSRSGVTTNVLG